MNEVIISRPLLLMSENVSSANRLTAYRFKPCLAAIAAGFVSLCPPRANIVALTINAIQRCFHAFHAHSDRQIHRDVS